MYEYIQKYAKQEWMIRVVSVIQYIYCGIVFLLSLLMLYSVMFLNVNVEAIISVYVVSSAIVIGITVHSIRLDDARRDIMLVQHLDAQQQDERVPFVVIQRTANYNSGDYLFDHTLEETAVLTM